MAIQLRLDLEPAVQPAADERFEGPLDLLLLLIEQRRLPITRISLAQVADQYLAKVHALPDLDPDLLAEFLQIGSRLLLLKSRALLLSTEPDPEVEEVASDLAERLATYRVFRAAAEVLQELEHRDERTYAASREPLVSTAPPPLAPLAPEALRAAFQRLLAQPRAEQIELPGVARASVEQRRALILDAVRASPRVSFQAIAGATVDQVIATFLAVLELFRRHQIDVQQPAHFGDLWLVRAAEKSDRIDDRIAMGTEGRLSGA